MSIKKQNLKNKPVCKETFNISDKEANGSKSVCILGDFNSWDNKATPLKSLKDGSFTATIELEPNRNIISNIFWVELNGKTIGMQKDIFPDLLGTGIIR